MSESTTKYDAMETKYMSNIASLQIDLCSTRSKHKLDMTELENNHSSWMREASTRIHKATENTLALESNVREEMLEIHQKEIDELEKEMTKQCNRANHASDEVTALKEKMHNMIQHETTWKLKQQTNWKESKSPGRAGRAGKVGKVGKVGVTADDIHQMRVEVHAVEESLIALKTSLDANEESSSADANATRVTGTTGSVTEKIHFVEKLQADRRALKLKNRQLTKELAEMKIVHTSRVVEKCYSALNEVSRVGGSGSRSGKKQRRQGASPRLSTLSRSLKVSTHFSPKTNKKAGSGKKRVSGTHMNKLSIVTENKENNIDRQSPRSQKIAGVGRLRVSHLNSPRSLV